MKTADRRDIRDGVSGILTDLELVNGSHQSSLLIMCSQ